MVLVCANVGAGAASDSKPANLPCHLLLYPRYHLDHSSLLVRHHLSQVGPLLKLGSGNQPQLFSFGCPVGCIILQAVNAPVCNPFLQQYG